MIFVFSMLCYKPTFHSSLSPSSRGTLVPFSFLPLEWYHLCVWGYWYFSWQFWFQLELHPVWQFTQKLDKQSDNTQPWHTPFPIWNQFIVPCLVLDCIQVSQEAGKIWYSILLMSYPQFVVIHTKALAYSMKQKEIFFWNSLVFLWSRRCWQFDLWFIHLF